MWDLVFDESALRAVAKKALERNTGARVVTFNFRKRFARNHVRFTKPYRYLVLRIVDEAVINGTAKPTYKAERLPQVTTPELVEKRPKSD